MKEAFCKWRKAKKKLYVIKLEDLYLPDFYTLKKNENLIAFLFNCLHWIMQYKEYVTGPQGTM